MKDIKQVTEALNGFRTTYKIFSTNTFQEYAIVFGIPYRGQILASLVRKKVIIRTKPGFYQWVDKPVHYLKVQSIIGECKELANKTLKKNSEVQITTSKTMWTVNDLINSLTSLDIEVESPEEIKEISEQEKIEILKILGYKLFKRVTIKKEI